MKRLLAWMLVCVLLLGAVGCGCSKKTGDTVPLMWKVTDAEGHALYLFGTIHVGDKRSDEVLPRVAKVLDTCDALAVEFDLVAYQQDYSAMMQTMMQYVLNDGTTVDAHMPEDLYARAHKLLEEAGLMPEMMKNYNLAMWSQLVEQAAIMKYSDLSPDKAMDMMLINHAYEKEIPVLEVESAEFQSGLLNSFEDETYLLQIRTTLDSLDQYGAAIELLYSLWLSGDRETFWMAIGAEPALEGDDAYNEALVDDRNRTMAQKAEAYLLSGKTVFFAVGAAHMANETGVVQLLRNAGYTVEEIGY